MSLHLAAWNIEKLVDLLGPLFVLVFFFIVPIVRTIRESMAKAKEAREVGRPAPGADPDVQSEADQGRKAWDDLLRGDAPAPMSRVPAAPPPVPTASSTWDTGPLVADASTKSADTFASREGTESASRAPSLSGQLSDFAPTPTEEEEETALDEERLAREMNEKALREEFGRRATFLRNEREQAARKTVAPQGISTFETEAPELAAARAPSASQRIFGRRLDRATLRRAFVASEILGRPRAFRAPDDDAGPFALKN